MGNKTVIGETTDIGEDSDMTLHGDVSPITTPANSVPGAFVDLRGCICVDSFSVRYFDVPWFPVNFVSH